MPTKKEESVLYVRDGKDDEWTPMYGINPMEIEHDDYSDKDLSSIFKNDMIGSFEISFNLSKIKFLWLIMPNNWRRMHGYPMSRKSRK